MLFTTAQFAFVFMPLVLLVFFLTGLRSPYWAAGSLFIASVVFYSFASLQLTVLLLSSIVVNFLIGTRTAKAQLPAAARAWMIAGVGANLAALAYFKYAGFLVNGVLGPLTAGLHFHPPPLPVGISFYTFTQIAYQVDTYQRKVKEYRPIHYGLFVTFFPHLVAGPVLHHAQMMPQFQQAQTYRLNMGNAAAGLAIFAMGLLKKVIIADYMSPYADAVFNAAARGAAPTSLEAWVAALAYTFQLYFDFSGYSDMAVGLSWMLNIRLPFNFNSPYQALSVSDFWRRWHMSLSTFLRDYLYIPLGGSRHGPVRRYVNLAVTMLLGGLWHGASWTFVWWGGLHGIYLGINHAFRAAAGGIIERLDRSRVFALLSWSLTFLSVIAAWVFFRATTFGAAERILRAMVMQPHLGAPAESNLLLWNVGLDPTTGLLACALLGLIAVAAPNSNVIGEWVHARCLASSRVRALVTGFALAFVVLLVVLNESRSAVSPFIYFNF